MRSGGEWVTWVTASLMAGPHPGRSVFRRGPRRRPARLAQDGGYAVAFDRPEILDWDIQCFAADCADEYFVLQVLIFHAVEIFKYIFLPAINLRPGELLRLDELF